MRWWTRSSSRRTAMRSSPPHALDRVLLWNAYVVPQWHSANERIAYWNKFGARTLCRRRQPVFPDVWWYDTDLAAKNGLK